MGKMGKYCKAYSVGRLREFNQWKENLQNTRKEKKQIDGKEVEVNRELKDDDYLYLQENFVVTDGIFIDDNVIFSDVSPEWMEYCKNTLNFEVPVYEPVKVGGPQEEESVASNQQ